VDRRTLAARINNGCHLEGALTFRFGHVIGNYFDKYLFESEPKLLQGAVAEAAPPISAGTRSSQTSSSEVSRSR
jgi:orotate phosphoribosyltransferase